jgi:hypothetical protein
LLEKSGHKPCGTSQLRVYENRLLLRRAELEKRPADVMLAGCRVMSNREQELRSGLRKALAKWAIYADAERRAKLGVRRDATNWAATFDRDALAVAEDAEGRLFRSIADLVGGWPKPPAGS